MLDILASSMVNAGARIFAPMETIGERVARYREALGLNQADLAKKVGITRSAINQIESGETKSPSAETLFRLADALGVDARALVLGRREASEQYLTAQLIASLPPAVREEATEYVVFRAERAAGLVARDKLPSYLKMLDTIKADMAAKRKLSGD